MGTENHGRDIDSKVKAAVSIVNRCVVSASDKSKKSSAMECDSTRAQTTQMMAQCCTAVQQWYEQVIK
jgi:hypothetical protein